LRRCPGAFSKRLCLSADTGTVDRAFLQPDRQNSGGGVGDILVMSGNFAWDWTAPAGTLELVKATGETVEGALILMIEWPSKLPKHLRV